MQATKSSHCGIFDECRGYCPAIVLQISQLNLHFFSFKKCIGQKSCLRRQFLSRNVVFNDSLISVVLKLPISRNQIFKIQQLILVQAVRQIPTPKHYIVEYFKIYLEQIPLRIDAFIRTNPIYTVLYFWLTKTHKFIFYQRILYLMALLYKGCQVQSLPRENMSFISYSYKALLDIHLLNMAKHFSGLYSRAMWPPP